MGSTLIAASSRMQASSHLPQPVQSEECTTGMNRACLPLRLLCWSSRVIALPRTGQTLKHTSQRRPWKAMQASWSVISASPMRALVMSVSA